MTAVLVAFAFTTAFELARSLKAVPVLLPSVLMIIVLAAGAVLAGRLRLPPSGLAAGALLTYAWVGLKAALALRLAPI